MKSFFKHIGTAFASAAVGAAAQGLTDPLSTFAHPKAMAVSSLAAGLVGIANFLRTPPHLEDR